MLVLVWSRWGTLVPVFGTIGFVVAVLAMKAMHSAAVGGLAFALVAGGGLYLAHRRIQEGSGHVYYDAQNDQPVVVGESSGHFWLLPLPAWAVIAAVLGLGFAVLALFGKAPAFN